MMFFKRYNTCIALIEVTDMILGSKEIGMLSGSVHIDLNIRP